jgi:hypothetical protein
MEVVVWIISILVFIALCATSITTESNEERRRNEMIRERKEFVNIHLFNR